MFVVRHKLQHNFSRAAVDYDQLAHFQQVQTRRVLDAALMVFPHDALVVDIGCGTGYFAASAKEKRPDWRIVGVDIASGMCAVAATRCTVVAGDAASLPLADGSVDAAVSSLCYQWVDDHSKAFGELARVLRVGGRAIVATLGAATLCELRASAEAVDMPLSLLPMREFDGCRQALLSSGFTISFAEKQQVKQHYPGVSSLLASMRAIGAGNNFSHSVHGFMAPKRWMAMLSEYEKLRTSQGIPATWEHNFFVLYKPS